MNKPNMHKQLKIIVESPDNCGGTTLINNIIKSYKYPFLSLHYYANPDKEHPIHWGIEQYTNMFNTIKENDYVICDRAHLGELVYPKMYHGYDGGYVLSLENEFITSIETSTDNNILIVLIDEPENLIKRDDGLSFSINLEEKTKEVELFKQAYEKSNIKNKILINIKDYNEEALKKKVIDYIESCTIKELAKPKQEHIQLKLF